MGNLEKQIQIEIHNSDGEENASKNAYKWYLDNKNKKNSTDINPIDSYLHPGKIHVFKYNPKHKNVLDYYDKNPVVLSLGRIEGKDSKLDFGINLNFLPRKYRYYILDRIMTGYQQAYKTSIKKSKPIDQNFIKLNYEYMKIALKESGFYFALRSYIPKRRKSTNVISNDRWSKAALLDVQDFEGINENDLQRIFRDHLRNI